MLLADCAFTVLWMRGQSRMLQRLRLRVQPRLRKLWLQKLLRPRLWALLILNRWNNAGRASGKRPGALPFSRAGKAARLRISCGDAAGLFSVRFRESAGAGNPGSEGR